MHLLYCFIRLISMMTDIFVWYYAKGLNIQEEDPVDESEVVTATTINNTADIGVTKNDIVLSAWPYPADNLRKADKQ